jgi:hypothetical protein
MVVTPVGQPAALEPAFWIWLTMLVFWCVKALSWLFTFF